MPSRAILIASIRDSLDAIRDLGGDLDAASDLLPQGYKIISIPEPDDVSVPPPRPAQGRKKSTRSIFGLNKDKQSLWETLDILTPDYIPAAIRAGSAKRTPVIETQLWISGSLVTM